MAGHLQGVLFPEHTAEFAEVAQVLGGARSVAVVGHIRPDADALGSACGLAAGLRTLGTDASVVIGQPFPHQPNLDSVPGVGEVTYTDRLPETDLVVTVDCASADRTGAFAPQIMADPHRVVVVDHHETNPGFGGHNLVVIGESTTMLVRELFVHLGVVVDTAMAHCLYAGLVTDTGNFRWGTQRMHVMAAELLGFGLDTREIALRLMDAMSARDMLLLGGVLAGMEHHEVRGRRVCVFTIGVEVLREMSQQAVEAVIDYARAIELCDVGVVLKEQAPRYWNVSLRSSTVDVSRVAQRLGGGGHVPAAGLSASGARDDVVRRILKEV
ncbi:DHH family phosphoesterase [Corynebacterium timonense]|uniref:Phosphoesterase RecJ domain-containing protein n=1 Tax=Corynebacterium timonense TaxID=441500 RepID=A0A1H1N4I5_9CORY|nr:bifunctional oligoribonuclease/PAP phosphatase NrnA [Corynebacterium timonense]SDR93778.1 phosphoesterase RecJ domain-containing protein [Corynebacterium timonense]